MAVSGKIVVTDSGKRGVRSTGKTAVFNSNGKCAECCDGVCPLCEGSIPASFTAIFSGFTWCCLDVGGGVSDKYEYDLGNIDVVELTQSPYLPGNTCIWGKFIQLGFRRRTGVTCEGGILYESLVDVEVRLTRYYDAGNLHWQLWVLGSLGLPIFKISIDDQPSTCTGDLAFVDAEAVCAHASGVSWWTYGGAATVSPT